MGAGVVDEVVAAVGVAPDVDAGEGLFDPPGGEGFDPVVEAGLEAEVVQPGLAGWPAVVGGTVGVGVFGVHLWAGAGGVGVHVGGGA